MTAADVPDRGPLRRYLEARGVLGGFDRDHATVRLRAADGVALVGSYLPGPPGTSAAVVLAHGFAANRRKPAYVRLASALADEVAVLSIDLRGHGGSSGRCTLGDDEARDVEVAVRWLGAFGYQRIVAIGVSMGATAVLHAAARAVAPFDAVVTVSAPAYFRDPPQSAPMQRLDAVWRSPVQRRALRAALGVRLAGPEAWGWLPDPVDLAARMRVPYLAVHGVDDAYFPAVDAHALVAAAAGAGEGRAGVAAPISATSVDAARTTRDAGSASPPRPSCGAVAWIEPAGFGHAEDGLNAAFNQRLAGAVGGLALTGELPAAR